MSNATLVHEAGHAVIAHVLGVDIVALTLDALETRARRGDRDAAYRTAVVCLAGAEAEIALRGGIPDLEQARQWWSDGAWGKDLRNAWAYLDRAGGDPAVAPVRAAARALVRAHWDAITIVAAALAERGRLSGAEVAALLHGSP